MKSIIKVVFIALVFCSCNADIKTETINNNIDQNTKGAEKTFSKSTFEPNGKNDSIIYKNFSLIGKIPLKLMIWAGLIAPVL